MRQYRFTRRSFLSSVGGAMGLRLILGNMEAAAQGATSPPRFLMMHWPVGTIRYHFLPTGSGKTYTTSRILKPFEDAGLREDMIVLYGMNFSGVGAGMGGGHEAGTPMMATGATCPGTRANGGEADDAAAGGPSFDQIFLKNVPELAKRDGNGAIIGTGYANAICDSRVDSQETSTQCISYGYTKRSINAAREADGGSDGKIDEATPLLPELSPVQLYMNLFSGFMGGGGTPGGNEALIQALMMRKSVLDFSLGELAELRLLCPNESVHMIDAHADAIRAVERQISDQLANPMQTPMGCMSPAAPDPALIGKKGSRSEYGDRTVNTEDAPMHEQIGKLHAGIIRAAFQCDIIRVATFQWSPGTNHVSFKGMRPTNPNNIYMHHPLSHEFQNPSETNGSPPTDDARLGLYEFLVNIQTWYNQKTADILKEFKSAVDVNGAPLLDNTICTYTTEVAESGHTRSPMPAMIFGGKALGMQGGQFQQVNQKSHNAMWMSVAQAYFKTNDPIAAIQAKETPTFSTQNATPIAGLWTAPA